MLAVLPTLLVSVLSSAIILNANTRAAEAQVREGLATQSISLGRVRASVLAELSLYELWTDAEVRSVDDSIGGLSDTVMMPAVRSIVDEAFAQVDEAIDDADRQMLDTIRADLDELRTRRDAGDASIGPEVEAALRALRVDLDPDPEGAMTAEGSQAAALVQFQDYLESLIGEAALGTQLLVDRSTSPDVRLDFEAAMATTDTHLRLVTRSDELTGVELERLLDASAFGRIRELVAERPVGETPVSISTIEAIALLTQGADDFTDLTGFSTELADDVAANARTEGEAARRQRTIALWLVGGTALLTGAVSLVVGRRLARRLRRVSGVARKISDGELDPEPIDDGGSDDIALVAGSIDEMIGTLALVQRQLGALAEGRVDDEVLSRDIPGTVGRDVRLAVDRVREATDRLQTQADTDPLTGALNRRAFERALSERSAAAALMIIDLDRFKAVNDQLGHAAGDDVLVAVARRLLNVVRDGDLVGRLGGDEFVVATTHLDAVDGIVERISQAINQPISTSGGQAEVGASIGLARPEPGEALDAILRRADGEMYRAKHRSRAAVAEAPEAH